MRKKKEKKRKETRALTLPIQLVSTLTLSSESSDFVREMLEIILQDMLVIQEPRPGGPPKEETEPVVRKKTKKRIESKALAKRLEIIMWKGEDDEYFAKSNPPSPDPVIRGPQTVTITESAGQIVQRRRRSMTRTFPSERRRGEPGVGQDHQHRSSTIHEISSTR